MTAGTVLIIGPYSLDDTSTMADDLTSSGGAIVKNITSWQDIENRQVWFAICQEA